MNRQSLRRLFSPMVGAIGFGLFALFVVAATTAPFDFYTDAESIQAKWAETEWVFFYHDEAGNVLIDHDLVLNILFFVPLGFTWVFMVSPPKLWRACVTSLLVGAALSLFVEGLQVLTPDRTTQVADLWRNTLGAGIGGLIGGLIRPPLRKWARGDLHEEPRDSSPSSIEDPH